MNFITFVFGQNHYHATRYIRSRVAKGEVANRFRNITNPLTVRGLKSSENTTIEFIWLEGCNEAPKFAEMHYEMKCREGQGIVQQWATFNP